MKFLSSVKRIPGEDIVTVCVKGGIGPVALNNDKHGSDPEKCQSSRKMLGMILEAFEKDGSAVPTHFRFKNDGESERPGCFNQSRLSTMIHQGYLDAEISSDGLVYSVIPTEKAVAVLQQPCKKGI